jgi:hypothetical protein
MEPENSQPIFSNEETKNIQLKTRSPIAKAIFYLVIILILATIAYFGFSLLPKNDQKQESTHEKTKTATKSAERKTGRCAQNQEFSTSKQGYSLCFPAGWISKQLLPSDIAVGFDPSKIEAPYHGVISVTVSDKPEDLSIQEVITNSLKYEYDKTTVSGVRGTKVIFDRLKSDALGAYPKSIHILLPKNNRTYTLTLTSTEAEFQTNSAIFETFLSDFEFSDQVPKLPWSESRNILSYYPWPGDTIDNPVEINGLAIAFEGTVNIRVKDDDGHTLAETTLQAESGTERSSFKGKVEYDKSDSKKGFVEIYTLSAKDGEEQDKVSIPVNFQN